MTRRARSIGEFEGDPRVCRYLDEYTDPAEHYAFTTYDQAPVHDGPVTPADVLMANLLSLRLGWEDVIPLFAAGGDERFALVRSALDSALAAARKLPALEVCTPEQAEMPSLAKANEIAYAAGPYYPRRPRSWTSVTVSKVLQRLSPNIPIIDSRVKRFYGTNSSRDVRIRMNADLATHQAWPLPSGADRAQFSPPRKTRFLAWS